MTLDIALMKWDTSAPAPTIWAHSLNAITNMIAVIVFVRRLVRLFFSSAVFLAPTKWVSRGMRISDTMIVAMIHRIMVTPAANQGLFTDNTANILLMML